MNTHLKIANFGTGYHDAFAAAVSAHETEIINIRGNFNLAMIYDLEPETFLDLGQVLLTDIRNYISELENSMVEVQETYTQVDLSAWDARMAAIHTRMITVESSAIGLINNMKHRLANKAIEKQTSDRWFYCGIVIVVMLAVGIVLVGS